MRRQTEKSCAVRHPETDCILCDGGRRRINNRVQIRRKFNRRWFLATATLAPAVASLSCRSTSGSHGGGRALPARVIFVSQGKTALMNYDGTGLRYLEFNVPNQETWQPGGFFSDGRRVLFLSMEGRRDGPGRPFSEYYAQTPTHLWVYNLDSGALEEIAVRDRMAVFYTPQLLLNDRRMRSEE